LAAADLYFGIPNMDGLEKDPLRSPPFSRKWISLTGKSIFQLPTLERAEKYARDSHKNALEVLYQQDEFTSQCQSRL
jgi:hypothetical protein